MPVKLMVQPLKGLGTSSIAERLKDSTGPRYPGGGSSLDSNAAVARGGPARVRFILAIFIFVPA
jgi:hypothetical protein